MKRVVPGVIVVEGKTDIHFLSSFIQSEFVSVNGSAVSPKEIAYLASLPLNTPIYVLTDPDYPGMKIREHIRQAIPRVIDVFIPKESSIRHGKVGVAEANKDVVLDAFNQITIQHSNPNELGNLTLGDLMDLHLIGHEHARMNRDQLSTRFPIGHTNGKTLLHRLNRQGVTRDQIKEVLNEKTS